MQRRPVAADCAARAAATLIQAAARRCTARKLMLRRKAAAALITRMGKGRLPKKLAQRRRDAATLITRIARGKVTRNIMRGVAQARAALECPRQLRMKLRTRPADARRSGRVALVGTGGAQTRHGGGDASPGGACPHFWRPDGHALVSE